MKAKPSNPLGQKSEFLRYDWWHDVCGTCVALISRSPDLTAAGPELVQGPAAGPRGFEGSAPPIQTSALSSMRTTGGVSLHRGYTGVCLGQFDILETPRMNMFTTDPYSSTDCSTK